MHTTVDKHPPRYFEHVINSDGMAWTVVMPDCANEELRSKKYRATIPDCRLDHMSFQGFGYHLAWADTIDELIMDIKSFGVPHYSDDVFLNKLLVSDAQDKRYDRQVTLYEDGRRASVLRGEYNINNMTAYTSF